MAIGTNSYGSTSGVAALVPKYANPSALFDETTKPTLAYVETSVDQVSGIMNSILAELGFAVPVTDDDVKDMLDGFANMTVSHVVEYANGTGRFGPRDKTSKGRGLYSILMGEIKTFLEGVAAGMERLGATRSQDLTSGIASLGTDNSGDEVFPIFQREMMGQTWTDWDSD